MKVEVVYTNNDVKIFNDVVTYFIDDDDSKFSVRLNDGSEFGHTLFVCDSIFVDDFCKWTSAHGIIPYDDC
ncbi:MAG: hypothetical protein J6T10_23990 [Methanobrevibacter sp.]|nr:hypothetical protein [Methanobrevibacter sp.]